MNMWVLLENPNPVRDKKFPEVINLTTGDRFYIDIVTNQHEVETDLHVWGNWMNHGTKKLFTGSESECVDFINRIAKRLGALNMPCVDISEATDKAIC